MGKEVHEDAESGDVAAEEVARHGIGVRDDVEVNLKW